MLKCLFSLCLFMLFHSFIGERVSRVGTHVMKGLHENDAVLMGEYVTLKAVYQ